MTCCTFDGAGLERLMAFDASLVEGIGPFQDRCVFDFIGLMTITAYVGRLRRAFICSVTLSAGNKRCIVILWVMMAVPAGKPVGCLGRMRVVVKKNLAGCDLEYHSHGLFRWRNRKGGIA